MRLRAPFARAGARVRASLHGGHLSCPRPNSVTCPEGERLWPGPHWLAVGALYSSITFHVCVCAGGRRVTIGHGPPPGAAHSSGRKNGYVSKVERIVPPLAFGSSQQKQIARTRQARTCCRSAERLPIAQPKRLAAPPCLTAARPCLTLRRWRRVPSANRHHGNPGVRADGGSAR